MSTRLKGNITIRSCSPINTEQIQIFFSFKEKSYSWITSWRRGTDITHSIKGDIYKVSFTDCGNGKAKNVRTLRK